MSRQIGYYWVILKDTTKWRMGHWNGVNWRIYGHNAMLDTDFTEIDPNPIVREDREADVKEILLHAKYGQLTLNGRPVNFDYNYNSGVITIHPPFDICLLTGECISDCNCVFCTPKTTEHGK